MAGSVLDKQNIFWGSARLIIADTTQTKPTKFSDIVDGAGALTAGYTDLGATDGGVTLSRSYDKEEWEVDQVLGAIDEFVTKWTMGIETNLAENSIENLSLAWNLGTMTTDVAESPDEGTVWINASSSIAEKMIIMIVDKREKDGTMHQRAYCFWRGKYDGSDSAQAYNKGEKTLLPVKFSLLTDTAETVDRAFGIVIDQLYVDAS